MPRRPLSTNRSNPAARMMTLRTWHSYIGAFIAPSVLFFALTGAVQLFNLHEAHDGYTPPALIAKLSAVHKDQEFKLDEHHDHASAPKTAVAHEDSDHADAKTAPSEAQIRIWILKWVFVLVALGLFTSTLIGLWMALTVGRRRWVTVVLFLLGAAVPVLLVAL